MGIDDVKWRGWCGLWPYGREKAVGLATTCLSFHRSSCLRLDMLWLQAPLNPHPLPAELEHVPERTAFSHWQWAV